MNRHALFELLDDYEAMLDAAERRLEVAEARIVEQEKVLVTLTGLVARMIRERVANGAAIDK